jgi:mRNA interferase MazF
VKESIALPAAHALVVVCQMTSEFSDVAELRVTIDPTTTNGMRARSQVMADTPVTILIFPVEMRIGRRIGLARLNIALAFVMGLAD